MLQFTCAGIASSEESVCETSPPLGMRLLLAGFLIVASLQNCHVWMKTAIPVVEYHFFRFCLGKIRMNFDILVSDKNNDVGNALVGTDNEFFGKEFVLATHLDVFISLEFARRGDGPAEHELPLNGTPFLSPRRARKNDGLESDADREQGAKAFHRDSPVG